MSSTPRYFYRSPRDIPIKLHQFLSSRFSDIVWTDTRAHRRRQKQYLLSSIAGARVIKSLCASVEQSSLKVLTIAGNFRYGRRSPGGGSFHSLGPATEKLLSLNLLRHGVNVKIAAAKSGSAQVCALVGHSLMISVCCFQRQCERKC